MENVKRDLRGPAGAVFNCPYLSASRERGNKNIFFWVRWMYD